MASWSIVGCCARRTGAGRWRWLVKIPHTFRLEWPPKSGKFQEFPEIDQAKFFTVDAAAEKMHPAEYEFVQRLDEIVFAREGERRDG